MVLIRERTQEEVNRVLRPHKRRFGKAKRNDPHGHMQLYAEKHLRRFRPRQVLSC